MSPITDAALALARLGWPIVPLRGKRPIHKDWPNQASTDEHTILAWLTENPDANIGVATGRSGFFVLDVDGPAGEDSLATLIDAHGELPATLQAQTGGGGRHILFNMPAEGQLGNAKRGLGPKLDIRGLGGQIVVAPSVHPDTGEAYRWASDPTATPIADAPGWLLEILRRPPIEPRPAATAPIANIGDERARRYGLGALESAARELAGHPAGGRNDELNRAAFKVAQLAWATGITEDQAADALHGAAVACGLIQDDGEEQFRLSFRSGWRHGLRNPRTLPEAQPELTIRLRPRVAQEAPRDDEEDEGTPDEPEGPRWPQYRYTEITNRPPVPWLIEGAIQMSSLVMVNGESNIGKSFVVLDIAAAVATGRSWAGRETRPGRVVYVSLEGSLSDVAKRVRAWMASRGYVGNLENLTFVEVAVPLSSAADVTAFAAELAANGEAIDLIIFDTLALSVPGSDENDTKDANSVVANLRWLKAETGATLMIVHHSRKGDAATERGSTAFRGAMDTQIVLVANDDGFQVRCNKQRAAERFEPTNWKLEPVEDTGSVAPMLLIAHLGAEENGERPAKRVQPLSDSLKLALRFIRQATLEDGGIGVKELARRLGKAPGSASYAKDKLLLGGFILWDEGRQVMHSGRADHGDQGGDQEGSLDPYGERAPVSIRDQEVVDPLGSANSPEWHGGSTGDQQGSTPVPLTPLGGGPMTMRMPGHSWTSGGAIVRALSPKTTRTKPGSSTYEPRGDVARRPRGGRPGGLHRRGWRAQVQGAEPAPDAGPQGRGRGPEAGTHRPGGLSAE